jgi:hypothetical protein
MKNNTKMIKICGLLGTLVAVSFGVGTQLAQAESENFTGQLTVYCPGVGVINARALEFRNGQLSVLKFVNGRYIAGRQITGECVIEATRTVGI